MQNVGSTCFFFLNITVAKIDYVLEHIPKNVLALALINIFYEFYWSLCMFSVLRYSHKNSESFAEL